MSKKEIGGKLPLIIDSSQGELENYQVYGKTVENLFDISEYTIGGTTFPGKMLTLEPNTAYTMSSDAPTYNSGALIVLMAVGETATTANNGVYNGHPITKTTDANGNIYVGLRDNGSSYDLSTYKTMLVKGSTIPIRYAPYGTPDGAGEETENLFDKDATDTDNGYVNRCYIKSDGTLTYPGFSWMVSEYISVEPNTDYTIGIMPRGAAGTYNAFYDANKELISTVENLNAEAKTFTTPANASYIRLSIRTAESETDTYMLVKGSIFPTTYIPFGYKIPILCQSGVTENLFDPTNLVNGKSIDQNGNLVDSPKRICTPNRVSVSGSSITISYTLSDSAPSWLNVWFIAAVYNGTTLVARTASNTDGAIIDITGGDNILIGWYATAEEYVLTIDDIKDIMLTPGSTPPDHYIPHRYESNYDLFIGSTQLGEDEYVDFVEQKVYKRTENLISKDFFLENYTITEYYLAIGVMSFDVEPNTTYWLKSNYTDYIATWYITNTIGADVLYGAVNGILSEDTPRSVTSSADGKIYVWGRVSGNGSWVQNMTDSEYIMLVEGSTAPSSYIPYLQPTDPPISLPAISLYEGKNTLTSTEDIKKMIVTYGNENISTVEINDTFYDINDIFARGMIADEYNNNLTYTIGDFCYYCGFLYRCINNCSGNWNSDNWEQTTLANILKGFNITIEEVL